MSNARLSDPDRSHGRPESPCVRNCCLDMDDVCMGCNRTLREICDWHKASDAEKIEILTRCEARAKARLDRMPKKT